MGHATEQGSRADQRTIRLLSFEEITGELRELAYCGENILALLCREDHVLLPSSARSLLEKHRLTDRYCSNE